MKQSILVGKQQSRVEERNIPSVGTRDVLIKVHICGVCASEFHSWLEGDGCPRELGHEVVGEVVEVGSDVERVATGMRVTGLIYHGFAEYAVAPENLVIPVPDGLTDEEALGEPLSCVVSGARHTPVDLGDRIAIIGLGYMGQLTCQMLRLKGPSHVVAIDVRDDALALAQRLGADAIMHPQDVTEDMKLLQMEQIGEGRGFDVVAEVSGTQAGLTLAGELTREHGVLSIVGYHQGGPRTVDMKMWNWKAFDVVNAHERRKEYQMDCMRRGLELVKSGRINTSELVSHRFDLDSVDEAFAALKHKPDGFVKAIIEVDPFAA